MTRSLRSRLAVGTALAVSAAFALAGALVYVLARGALYDQLDDALAAQARALTVLVEQEGDELDNDLGRTPAPEFAAGGDGYFELWLDGASIVRSASLGDRRLAPPARPARDLELAGIVLPDGRPGRRVTFAFTPRRGRNETAPPLAAVLAVARPTADVDARVARLRGVLVIGGIAATAVCVGLLLWIGALALAPIRRLADQIAGVDARTLDVRFASAATPTELRPVVERLDAMVSRLGDALARERRLTAEIAHELRTPVTGLKATLELALSRDRDPAAYREAMGRCLAICDQTHRMVEALLHLTRLDAGTAAARRARVDIGATLADVIAGFAPRAADRGLAVTVAIAPGVSLVSDPDWLRVVFSNLLDNAVTYADRGGSIDVTLTSGPAPVVTVSNTGSQLAAADVRFATDRFWRGDAARSAGDHAGLGLALCAELLSRLGATLELASSLGGRFVATIRL